MKSYEKQWKVMNSNQKRMRNNENKWKAMKNVMETNEKQWVDRICFENCMKRIEKVMKSNEKI